jgi:hypothetical protein
MVKPTAHLDKEATAITRVMVTDNVAMHGGVANGCQGILQNIKYEFNEYNERRAVCAYVHVPGANIHAPGLPHDVIPFQKIPVSNIIYQVKKDIMLVDHSYHCYPLMLTLQTKYKVNH